MTWGRPGLQQPAAVRHLTWQCAVPQSLRQGNVPAAAAPPRRVSSGTCSFLQTTAEAAQLAAQRAAEWGAQQVRALQAPFLVLAGSSSRRSMHSEQEGQQGRSLVTLAVHRKSGASPTQLALRVMINVAMKPAVP